LGHFKLVLKESVSFKKKTKASGETGMMDFFKNLTLFFLSTMILSRIFIFIILKVTCFGVYYLILERFVFLSPFEIVWAFFSHSKPDKGEQPLIAIAIPALAQNVILSFSTLTSNNSVVNCIQLASMW
jgi:uncharacterized membrane-anchored protein